VLQKFLKKFLENLGIYWDKKYIMNCPSREQIEYTLKSKGYKWFDSGEYNVNIVGIRNSSTGDKVTNQFDDCMTISYMENGLWNYNCFNCTTDPGRYYMEDPLSSAGCAILKPGQYRGAYQIGLHNNEYEALVQVKPVLVYRDNNRDDEYNLNESSVQSGLFGINIHRATSIPGNTSTQVDKWSAGCQVIASYDAFQIFMAICNASRYVWGNSFTYTLIDSDDLL